MATDAAVAKIFSRCVGTSTIRSLFSSRNQLVNLPVSTMNTNPVIWFEIYVQDMNRAKRFYEMVLQRTLSELKSPMPGAEMWAFSMDQNAMGASGMLVKMPGVPSCGGGTLVYFACQDCAVEEARVVTAGGLIKQTKMSIGEYGNISLAYDTEGNLFGLHSM
jgi:predicted enzyme related to lactoylglutathione lyase